MCLSYFKSIFWLRRGGVVITHPLNSHHTESEVNKREQGNNGYKNRPTQLNPEGF